MKIQPVLVIKSKRAVGAFRKVLRAKLRQGLATLRVLKVGTGYVLGIQLNGTVHIYSAPYVTMTQATLRGWVKFKTKAVQVRKLLAA